LIYGRLAGQSVSIYCDKQDIKKPIDNVIFVKKLSQ